MPLCYLNRFLQLCGQKIPNVSDRAKEVLFVDPRNQSKPLSAQALTPMEDIHQNLQESLHTAASNSTLKCNLCEIFIKAKRVLALLRPCKDLLQATFLTRVLVHYN